jgi:hypothetical protein
MQRQEEESMKNIKELDRFLRAWAGLVALLLALFWLGGIAQIIAYVVGAILLLTALIGFCPIYALLGMGKPANRSSPLLTNRLRYAIAAMLLVATAAGGAYVSQFFSKKFFLEDFNAMNNFYKQTLFLTGKGEREQAIKNYDHLLSAYSAFQAKYRAWQPVALKGDKAFAGDLELVASILAGVNDPVRTGDLHQAHLALEGVRPVFQAVFKRNGFSMLAVTLVDFHDAMELMLDAGNAKDAAKLQSLYPEVDTKMKAIEAEASDVDIQAIRTNLDGLNKAAQEGDLESLPKQADQLKSSFVKVYLQRG